MAALNIYKSHIVNWISKCGLKYIKIRCKHNKLLLTLMMLCVIKVYGSNKNKVDNLKVKTLKLFD